MARILVVDDEIEILKVLRRSLRHHGFEVEIALGGQAALDVLDAVAPDVVISDFTMPGMSGAELLARVRQRMPGIARFLLSGYAAFDSLSCRADASLARFMPKPWDERELVAEIRRALSVNSGAQPLETTHES